MLGFLIRNLGENQRVKRSLETRAEKVGWKTARTQVDARRARRMSTVCGGARGRRGRARGPRLRSGPGEVVGGGRGVQARAGLGAEGPTDAPAAGGSREGGGPRRGVAAPGGLRASLLLLARERPEGHGRPRSPRPGKGLPALGGARVSCWVAACSPGRGGQKGQNPPDSAGGPTPRAPSGSLSVSLGVFSQSCRKAEGGRPVLKPGKRSAVAGTLSLPSGAPSPASRSPAGAAASVAPPGAGNMLMALALGREPGMTLGIRAAGWRSPRCSLTGSVGRCLKRHLFLELLGLYFMKYSDCQRSCRFPFGRRQP